MKRIIYLICTISILFSLTACKKKCKNHEYDNNCDAICSLCGEERDAQAHQWNAANCTLPETCNDCGLTKGEALGHNLDYYEGYEASCVEDGIIDYWYCKTCNTKFLDEEGKNMVTDEDLYFSTDTHSLTHHELIEATCTEDGKKEYYDCYICETYFTDEKATQIIEYEDLTIPKKEHIDENEDYICDQGCGEVLLEKEKLQQIIENTMSSTKVTVKEKYIPGASNISYYFDENLLYINDEYYGEKYYYSLNDITYLFTKSDDWSKETTTEVINYNISYLFDNKYNLEISSELSVYNCNYGFFEGSIMFRYTNTLGIQVDIKLNDDSTLLEGIYILDENNNIIYMFEMVYGNDEKIVSTFEDINNYLDGNKYDETTNTYTVDSSQGILNAIDNAEVSGTIDNPATIKLMNDINVETEVNELGYADYGILIESGNIIIDLNGFQLSELNDASSIIQIGSEWGETYNAVVTIEDSSIDKSGKIVSSYIGIYNQGGTLIFNNGIIEVNNTKGDWASAGINQYLGSITMNGGSILVTSVADSWSTCGIDEDGTGGTVTINGGYINVNGPTSRALYLRGTAYINGGTITSNRYHIVGDGIISLQTNEAGIGATFVGGINSGVTLNSLLIEGVGYYDANGNLIEVSDDVKEILDKGDITIKKIN